MNGLNAKPVIGEMKTQKMKIQKMKMIYIPEEAEIAEIVTDQLADRLIVNKKALQN